MDIRHCWLPALPGVVDDYNNKDEYNNANFVGHVKGEGEGEGGGGGDNKKKKEKHDKIDKIEIREKKDKKVLVVAKHLCGLASDLAIHSLGQDLANSSMKRRGCAIATCCHHCCSWDDYGGREWLRKLPLPGMDDTKDTDTDNASVNKASMTGNTGNTGNNGFSPAEFAVMTRWSGWATGMAGEWSGRDGSKRTVDRSASAPASITSLQQTQIQTQTQTQTQTQQRKRNRKHGETSPNTVTEREGGDVERESGERDKKHKKDKEGLEKHTKSESHFSVPQGGYPRPDGLSKEERAKTGFMVKRLIDQGRVMYVVWICMFRAINMAISLLCCCHIPYLVVH